MPNFPALEDFYRDLHENPELSFQETRTAGLIAARLRELGFEVTEGVGQTGVVGVLSRGEGPTIMLRADMDGLPVLEETGLDYASKVVVDGTPVMHACGHDMHVTSLLGGLEALTEANNWAGKIIAVLQPAEEKGAGARAMVADGLFERFGTPEVVLGQHVAPLPAGALGLRSGPAFAASDGLKITLFGRGGHGSRPETTCDPVVLAASTIMRLQTIVSREIAGTDTAVLTIGAVRAGEVRNIIPDTAELLISIRTFDEKVREKVLAAVTRIVNGEAAAAGAPREPLIEIENSFPAVINTEAAVKRVGASFAANLAGVQVVDPGVITGSEDVGILAVESGAECAYWILGGANPAEFAECKSLPDIVQKVASLPSNHSPQYAPVVQPTITVGSSAIAAAAMAWLAAN